MEKKKAFLLGVGSALAALALVRLALDEVQLASHQAESQALRQEVAHAHSASQNAVRLQLAVEGAKDRSRELETKLALARTKAGSADRELDTARARLTKLQKATFSAQSELVKAYGEVRKAKQARIEARRDVAVLSKKLSKATQDAARLQESLSRAKLRARDLQVRLKASEGQLTKQRKVLASARSNLSATRAELTKARARALRDERILAKLKKAGVNVERLSGARPMPVLSAIVVQVDRKRVPPVVLVNAGAQIGVEKKDTLYVIRDGRQIARLEVDTVSTHLCSGRIVQGTPGKLLIPGDQVRSRAPRPE